MKMKELKRRIRKKTYERQKSANPDRMHDGDESGMKVAVNDGEDDEVVKTSNSDSSELSSA